MSPPLLLGRRHGWGERPNSRHTKLVGLVKEEALAGFPAGGDFDVIQCEDIWRDAPDFRGLARLENGNRICHGLAGTDRFAGQEQEKAAGRGQVEAGLGPWPCAAKASASVSPV